MEHGEDTLELDPEPERRGRAAPALDETVAALLEQLAGHRAAIASACDRFGNDVHTLGAGIARLERKLDRILAVSLDLRGRNRQ
jgi:hypothetical protein